MITDIIERMAVILACSAVSFAFGYHVKSNEVEADEQKAVNVQAEKVERAKDAQNMITSSTGDQYVTKVITIKNDSTEIAKKVAKYVASNPDHNCSVDAEWVSIHDAATGKMSTISETARITDETTNAAETLEAVTSNYEACRINYEAVLAWQLWASEQQKLNDQ